MKFWQQYPFIRILIPFIAGIIVAMNILTRNDIILYSVMVMSLALHFRLAFKSGKPVSYTRLWLTGLPMNFLLFCAGYQVTLLRTPSLDSDNISHHTTMDREIIITIEEAPVEKANSFKIIGKPEYIDDSSGWKQTSGKLLLYFEKDSAVSQIRYGDELVLHTSVQPVNPPGNPGEFNYKQYLANRGIYNQAYVKSCNWKIHDQNKGSAIIATALHLRNRFMEIFEAHQITGDEFAVVSALLLGCSDYLDSDQMRDYSGSGVMHILSVSGLHVGIIYVFLNFVLKFMDRRKSLKLIKAVTLILLIWFYALITGLSPSVLRASAMFSAIVIGNILNRNAHIYNTLAASAFVLLLYDPYLIMSVGFQLSYLAVAGIVWLYRPLNTLWSPRNRLVRFTWQTTAVSIAATVATLPLTLFYFRQFPNLFFIANLVAIPLSTMIIYLGILVLALSPFPILSSPLSVILVFLIKALNASVHIIENLPFSVIRGICIDDVQMVLLSLFIIFICSWLLVKNRRFLFTALVMMILMLIPGFIRKINHLRQHRIVVYNIPKASAIDFINGKDGWLLADSVVINEPSKFDFHIKNNRILSGLSPESCCIQFTGDLKSSLFFKKDCFIQFGEKRLVIVDNRFRYKAADHPVKVDYIIISHDPQIQMSELAEIFDFETVIFDNSNSLWRINRWISECKEQGYDYYSTRDSGALVVEE